MLDGRMRNKGSQFSILRENLSQDIGNNRIARDDLKVKNNSPRLSREIKPSEVKGPSELISHFL